MEKVQLIGERVKLIREWRGWSQGQLAYKANTTSAQISRIEKNERPGAQAVSIAMIAKALNTTVEYLVGLSDTPGIPEDELFDDPAISEIFRNIAEGLPRILAEDNELVMIFFQQTFGLSRHDLETISRMDPSVLEEMREKELLYQFRRLPPDLQEEAVREVERLSELRLRIIGAEEAREESPRGERNQAEV